jgi:hypothetical protein
MELPINANGIVKSLGFGGNAALYHKLKLVRDLIKEIKIIKKYFVNNTGW